MKRILEEPKRQSLENSLKLKEYILEYGEENEHQTTKKIQIQDKFLLELGNYDWKEKGFEYSILTGKINIGNEFFPQIYYFDVTSNTGNIHAQIRTPKEEPILVTPEAYPSMLKKVSREMYNLYIDTTTRVLEKLKQEYGNLTSSTKQNIEKIIDNSTPLAF